MGMQDRYAGACWNALMEEETKESIAEMYMDRLAEIRKLRADALERERVLREALERLCTELEYVHEAASAIEQEDVHCLIRTSEGEAAIKQARAALAQ